MAKKKTTKKTTKSSKHKSTVSKHADHAKTSSKMSKASENEKKPNTIVAISIIIILIIAAIFAITAFAGDKTTSEKKMMDKNPDAIATASQLAITLNPTEERLVISVSKTGETISITEKDLEYLSTLFRTNGMEPSSEQLIQEAIVRKVLIENAKDLSVDTSILEELKANPQFIANVEQNNYSAEQFISIFGEELEKDLIIQEFFNQKITAQVPSDEAFETSHILICHEESSTCVNDRTKEQALTIATELLAELQSDNTVENFAQVAIENSNGPSAPQGGYLGPVLKGMMVPEFEAATFSLGVGELSEIVETQFGYHIIRVSNIINAPNQQAIVETLTELRTQIIANAEITSE